MSAPGLYASEAGELNALRKLSSTDDAQADVIVELLDSVKPSGKVLPALVQAAVNVAQFDRTLWLDTTWLTAGSPLAQQRGGVFEYLDDIIESAVVQSLGLLALDRAGLVPVVSVDASNDELRRVRLLIEHKNRDIAIRIRRPAAGLGERIRSIMRLTGTKPGRVHAVIDTGFVETVRARQVASIAEAATTTSSKDRDAAPETGEGRGDGRKVTAGRGRPPRPRSGSWPGGG